MLQNTLKNSVTIIGIGLHTGEKCELKLIPAAENFGIQFFRMDLDKEKRIPAEISYVQSTLRATTLGTDGNIVQTVEHLLAALYSQGIDNLRIEVTGPEIPILESNAHSFIDYIQKAGIEAQLRNAEYFCVEESMQIKSSNGRSELLIFPSDKLEISCLVDFEDDVLGEQSASMDDLEDFEKEISLARTFGFIDELFEMVNQGLTKGGDLENALIFPARDKDFKLDDWAKVLNEDELGKLKAYLDEPIKLLFPNEPARHKLLDFVGDLALLGKRIKGKFVVKRPGHTANSEFVQKLKQLYVSQKRLKGKPNYDPNKEPVHDLVSIQTLLPHRYPFLLVDKIIEMTDQKVVGIKNISFNENFFLGHFPGDPIFPGVLQMEALAQTGGILALSNVEKPEEWGTYFLKMDKVKFKSKVVPGDTLILKMELLTPIRRGIVHMQGTAYVGNKIVSEGELTAQIVHLRKSVDE